MKQNPAFDSSIPVLTEVVLEPVPAESAAAPAEPRAAEPPDDIPTLSEALPPATEPVAEPAVVPAAVPIPEPDWDALELRIAERILAQLQPQLEAVVRNALASAGDQIHIGLRQTVEQMVAQQIAAVQK
ncbi:MAG: hypothetical protein ABWY02_04575 [Telluria sp.]